MPIAPETADYTFTNWSQRYRCTPDRLYRPRSTEDVVEIVREAGQTDVRLKVVGAGRAFSDVALTPPRGWQVSTEHMNRVLEVDRGRGRVRAQAGLHLGDLADILAQHKLALEALPGVRDVSLGGALATATHGAGLSGGSLLGLVTEIEWVGADAKAQVSTPDDPRFPALVAGLGALGIVTEVSLAVVPSFALEERRFVEPIESGLAALARRRADHADVRLVWFPYTDRIETVCLERIGEPARAPMALGRWWDDRLTAVHARRFVGWLTHVFPEYVPRLNRWARRLAGGRRTLVDRSDRLLARRAPAPHEAMCYGVPAEGAAAAFEAVRRAIESERIPVNGEVELSFARPERAWLSPAFGRETCLLRVAAHGRFVIDEYFPAFHAALLPFDPRPALGHVHGFEPLALMDRLPQGRAFDTLRRRLDPTGLFANDFVTRLFGP